MRASRCRWPFVQFAIMGSGYAGDRVADAITIPVEIARRPKGQVGIAVHDRRWGSRALFRLDPPESPSRQGFRKDFEATIASAHALCYAPLSFYH
jgi:putative transposase